MPSKTLLEGSRVNSNRNPRGENSAQYWAVVNTSGLTVTNLGSGVEDGIPYVDWQIFGVASANGFVRITFDAPTQIAATVSSFWAGSFFGRLLIGSFPSGAVTHQINEYLTDGTLNNEGSANVKSMTSAPLRTQPWTYTRQLTTTGTTRVAQGFKSSVANGESVSFTVRLGAPMLEAGTFPSAAPMLPNIGTLAASTRAAESMTMAWTFPRGTITWTGGLPQASPAGINQILFQLDDGTDTNRICVYNNVAGTTITLVYIVANSTMSTVNIGNFTPGVTFTIKLYHSYSGYAVEFNGGDKISVAVVQPTFNTLRVGRRVSASGPMFGYVESVVAIPLRLDL